MIRNVMGGSYESPGYEVPKWEPEPLQLPVDPETNMPLGEDEDHGSAEDVVGGHVVVIDFA